MIKNIIINKSYNIIKKLKTCMICHKFRKFIIFNNLNSIKSNKKFLYKKLYNFKNFKKFNLLMNNIVSNLNNKYILEISKYFHIIKLIHKFILIKLHKCKC